MAGNFARLVSSRFRRCAGYGAAILCGPIDRRCWKHSRQYTGRPCVGLNGTVVSFPHCEQTVLVSTRCTLPEPEPCARRAVGFARFAPLGLVLEALVGEKHLLAGGENELSRTFGALQNPIVVFHTLLHDLAGTGVAAEQSSPVEYENVLRIIHVPLIPTGIEPFEWTPVIWSPSLAHAVAFSGDAYARGPLWHAVFHLVSCSSCAF